MSFHFWMIGKTKESYLLNGIDEYQKRVSRYIKIESFVFNDIKGAAKLSSEVIKKKEADLVLENCQVEIN